MQLYKIVFFVPVEQKELVKEAIFAAGAGRYENYDKCSWEVLGTGQFRPLEGSNPFIGSQGAVERVEEYRVETLCKEVLLDEVLRVLVEAHPYEEPAYEAYAIRTL